MNLVEKYLRDERLEQLQRRKVRIPQARPKPPDGPALSYAVELRRYQKELNRLLMEIYEPLIETFRQDATTEELETGTEQAESFIKRAVLSSAILAGIVGRQGNTITNWNNRKYSAAFYEVMGFNAVPRETTFEMLKSWTRENISLIKGVNDEQIKKIERLLSSGGRQGLGPGVLRTEIKKIMDSSVSRATLIARDQSLKLNGQIDRVKQTGAGVDSYIWRTSRDERVRPKHQSREGNRYRWDDPPEGGHPGQAINCRCSAEPNFEEILKPI